MAALNAKLDTLATKSDLESMPTKTDLENLRTDLAQQVEVKVEASVKPVRAELADLSSRVKQLEKTPGTATGNSNSKDADYQRLLNNLDPALRRVTFKGFTSQDASSRLAKLTEVLHSFPEFTPLATLNVYKGPRNSRVLSDKTEVEFADADTARRFLTAAKARGGFTHNGNTLTPKPALTQVNQKRNTSLVKAEELVKGSAAAAGKEVKLDWSERKVKVNDTCAFSQGKNELGGTFEGDYAQLRLP